MSVSAVPEGWDLQIAILGPFEVLVDGRPVGPAGAKRRGLLALLALEAGRVVPVETLVDRLWGEDPPVSAKNVVQTYVSAWRAVLWGRDGPLRTVGTGYRLDVDDTQCDLSRFRAIVQSVRRSDPEEAEPALDEAVGLWRGPVLADLAGTPFHLRIAQTFEAERASAVEAWAEAALRVGREPAVVLERLAALVAAHPLRESAVALTMWAQAAAGRPSEALTTYDAMRGALRDELGADPSPLLREMHGRVLRADPALGPASPSVVVELPAGVARGDPLFGRDEDLVRVGELLEERRLVTLTGPGGAGKTRLAVEVLHRYAARGGVGWFVDLATVRDEALTASTVAASLGAPAAAGTDPEAALAARLLAVEGLLVLDNLEHLASVAAFVARLRAASPGVRLLLTSRSGLGIAGERQYPVPLLAVPDEQAVRSGGARALETVDGVRLLVDRATAADPSFRVTDDNAAAVAALVRRLDGLPLAIEITAPWLRMLSPEALLSRVSEAGLDLAAPRADLPPRQRTLRSTISWSYDLLSPAEQTVLRRLAVFVGTFSIEAAEGVCAGGDASPGAVAEHLLSLVDRHLVQPVTTPEGWRRFRLLETLREFASEQLDADPDRDHVRDGHLAFFSRWAVELASHSEGPSSGDWLALAVAEAGNLRSALQLLEDRGDHETLLQLAVDAMVVWFEAGHENEGERRLHAALAAAGLTAPARAIGLTYWAWLRATRDRAGAASAAQEALAIARAARDPLVEAFAQQTLGDTLDGEAALAASHAVFEAAERSQGRPVRYGPTAPDAVRCGASASIAAAWAHRSLDQALTWQRDALRLAEIEGDQRITAVNAARLAHLHLLGADQEAAEALVGRARTLVSNHVTARWEDIVAFAEAELAFHVGRLDEAEQQMAVLVHRSVSGGRPLHARLGSLMLTDLLTTGGRPEAAEEVLDRLAQVPGALDEPVAAASAAVRRARLDRLAGRDDAATLRLDTVEAVLPFDQLSPERVILLVERVLLSPTAGARRSHLRRLTDAQAATGVRLAPWEAALVR